MNKSREKGIFLIDVCLFDMYDSFVSLNIQLIRHICIFDMYCIFQLGGQVQVHQPAAPCKGKE
jgi:hypothetical protein